MVPAMRIHLFFLILSAGLIITAPAAKAEDFGIPIERAKGERLSNATGHYAKSRSLLIAAIREFDQGLKEANPEAVMDVAEWRSSLIDRAQELERLLDPQPRASRTGIRFTETGRLLELERNNEAAE